MSSTYDNGGQYTRHSILRYEKIFGHGFISTGGLELTRYFCDKIDLPRGYRVLDIGSGLGGAAFHMAEKDGASVYGVDLAPEMMAIAQERAADKPYDVEFHLGDIRTMTFPADRFDLVWSRDTLLHIPEKRALFTQLKDWLSDGGTVMFTDYARKAGTLSPEFQAYVDKSGYDLHDLETYAGFLKDAGFPHVQTEDWSEIFVDTLRKEATRLRDNHHEFLGDFSEEDLNYLLQRWEQKIDYCTSGNMRVGLWIARK